MHHAQYTRDAVAVALLITKQLHIYSINTVGLVCKRDLSNSQLTVIIAVVRDHTSPPVDPRETRFKI